jgi:hypothetical protein
MLAATVDDLKALEAAARDCMAILNCAGPFEDTARALIETALRAKTPYLDVAGETSVVADVCTHFDAPAKEAGVVVMPSASFYGALGDLLATAAAGGWQAADEVSIAIALDGWKPTAGTRAVVQRMGGRRLVLADGRLAARTDAPAFTDHVFPDPVGRQTVMADYPGPESVLVPRHLAVPDVRISMAAAALRDLRDPEVGGPVAADATGRSDQMFLVDVTVTSGFLARRAWARGRDIYATTAPILVEAMERVLGGGAPAGVRSPGELFDARSFLVALCDGEFQVSVPEPAEA